ncbi:MAG: copper-binding protein [Thiogranum sp.]|nr:copper-binding protein [Thiogranum sp.]
MNKVKTGFAAGLMSMLLSVAVGAAETQGAAEADREHPGVLTTAEATVTATVEAIDMENRVVTLRKEDGSVVDFVAGDEVRNLAQVEVGDKVVVEHTIGLLMLLGPSGSGVHERVDTLEAGRAELGEKPGGIVRKTVQATGTVVGVDREARTVTLKGPLRTVTLQVADDIDLDTVKVGDQVDAIFQESLAISVQAAPAD